MTISQHKASSILSVLAGAVVLLSSCDKENPQQYKYEATFYVGGNVAKDAAYIYKGNELLYRLDDNSTLSGLAVMEDGKRLDVDFGGTTGSIQNMVKSGKDWLCCGTITGDDGKNYGIIIENGKVVFRSGDPVSFDYMCLGASGDYYVLVTDLGSVELWRIDAETKQLVSSETIASQEGYDAWFGICMYVGLRDIAVGTWKMNLLEEIKTPKGFNANAWEVTVEKVPVQ